MYCFTLKRFSIVPYMYLTHRVQGPQTRMSKFLVGSLEILFFFNKKVLLQKFSHAEKEWQHSVIWLVTCKTRIIEIKNNKDRHNLRNVKFHHMVFRSVDGAIVGSFLESLGQTKVMHSHQKEITWSFFLISLNYKRDVFSLLSLKEIFIETHVCNKYEAELLHMVHGTLDFF